MRSSAAFASVVRGGRRSGRHTLVVHLAAPQVGQRPVPTSAGFVVSRAVGGAVVRNRVKRRLRFLVARRLDRLPDGARLVVRALPPAAGASSDDLARDLDRALDGALRTQPVGASS